MTAEPTAPTAPTQATRTRVAEPLPLRLHVCDGLVSIYGTGAAEVPTLAEAEAARRLLAFRELLYAALYARDVFTQQTPDGTGGVVTVAQRLAGIGGVCAEQLLADALARLAPGGAAPTLDDLLRG
jgi:hypothetical protein